MTFLNPLFAWGFLSLAVILALYLLKRKYETRQVPSTFLWRRASLDTSANRPFQRLKRNILLPIQLLMAAVLVLALMRPMLPGGVGGETVMIFDLSASMQAADGGKSRLDEAIEAASGMIDGMNSGDALTILAAGDDTRQCLTRSTDRDAARRVLKSLVPSNGSGDLSGALSLAQAMQREVEGLSIVVFSDDYVPDAGVAVHNAAKGLDNRAVLSFTVEGGTGYARVMNYGSEVEVTLACYAEGALCDARTLHIPAGESAGTAPNVPDCRWAYVEIQERDAIHTDNRLYHVARLESDYTVALSGEGSIFLERAIALREDIKIVRTTDEERASIAADLYVYGDSPLLFSLDAEQTNLQFGEALAPEGTLSLSGRDDLTAGLTLSGVAVREYRPVIGGKTLMTIDGQSVMAADGRSVALGFDIHDTTLPMKYDFPILVQNILSALLPQAAADVGDGTCGETVEIPVPPDCKSAWIESPGGKKTQLSMVQSDKSASGAYRLAVITNPGRSGSQLSMAENGAVRFADTAEAGLYTLSTENGERYFSLHMPLSESDVRSVAPSVDSEGSNATFESGRELTQILIALFLALLMIEWVVRRRVA
ncbi:MAG: BatA and WFA domain-containing protein [Clostridia bacterium]|nr:BatA and WFA domain-containing protein [Clostridia bacterium]